MSKVSQLAVLLKGLHVADLGRDRSGTLRLRYVKNTPISLSLPAEMEIFTSSVVSRWLRALLPENETVLAATERLYGLQRNDIMDFLRVMGRDCAGAVQFCEPDDIEATINRQGALHPVSDTEIERRLAEMELDEAVSWTMPGENWSLGGYQQKFALRRQDNQWFLASGSEPTTHIVKPGVRHLRLNALIEHISMATAHRVGLNTAETSYDTFVSQDALVVTRFDRVERDGYVSRIHQEDLCQAMGAVQKYESLGGPSVADVVRFLRSQSTSASAERANVHAFVDAVIFNTVIGAPDAHLRNYAIHLNHNGPHMTPLFDVATGLAYDSRQSRKVCMSIGGVWVLDDINDDAWKRFAGELALDEDRVLARVRELAARVIDESRTVISELATVEYIAEVEDRLVVNLENHARRIGGLA